MFHRQVIESDIKSAGAGFETNNLMYQSAIRPFIHGVFRYGFFFLKRSLILLKEAPLI